MGDSSKRRIWKWSVLGLVLILFIVVSKVVLFPSTPYRFLNGATLLQLDRVDDNTPLGEIYGTPVKESDRVTLRIYVSPLSIDVLQGLMREELTTADGWKDATYTSLGPLGNLPTWFSRGKTDQIIALPLSENQEFGFGYVLPEGVKGRSLIQVANKTTIVDLLRDRVHKDRLELIFSPPSQRD